MNEDTLLDKYVICETLTLSNTMAPSPRLTEVVPSASRRNLGITKLGT